MRLRSSSIRAKMIALLMVPIVALTGLWVYATLVTTGDVWTQLDVSSAYRAFGAPIDQYARDLQNERKFAVVRLADPEDKDAQEKYQQSKAVTDRSLQLLRYQANSSEESKLDGAQRLRLEEVLAAGEGIATIRGEVDQQVKSWDKVIDRYADLVQPVFAFRTAFVSRQSGQLPRQGMVLTELVRAREYLSQEDAALRGLRLTLDAANRPGSRSPKPDNVMYQTALDALHSQQTLFKVYVAELEPQDQADYRTARTSDSMSTVAWAEVQFESFQNPAEREAALLRIPLSNWNNGADLALGELSTLNTRLAGQIGALAKSYAVNQLVRGGIAGLLGLIAVVASVMISYRIGRGLARELINLRNAALDLSGARLPALMLRLRRGEPVDIAAESPELEFGPAEIGEVGRAFNQVQRVAVEAAVEQAELRRGVSAVFVNLARRSQVLLHRQLTLLDTMERRTEDPAELEDLFKLDHLTTRMRRHAEGLIILSGGSPGRAWRKPVRMVDVVRAAVGEVEDYARVIVRPFPGTGLLGSAVADVTHLIAELVENAAVYSPPQAQVTVQGEVVAHGFSLEIDDRGLGLSEQALADINQRLAVEQEFDLADTDRLGLFVVSRLARRHGIRVHLRPSPYGGTAAIVLIPRELLAEAPDLLEAPAGARPAVVPPTGTGRADLVAVPALGKDEAEGRTGDGGTGGHRRGESAPVGADEPVRAAGRPVGGPRPSAAEPARTPGGLPRRRSVGGPPLVPAGNSGTGRHRRADSPPEEGPVPAPVTAPGGGLLPRRVRQANLAPQLRSAEPADTGSEGSRDRSPEEARSAFSSFQRGFQRGRGDRIQPASLTVVPDQPAPAVPAPAPPVPRRRAALPAAPRPQALSAGPARPVTPAQPMTPARPVTPAQPAPTEGTES
ncbi:nitrate- and nitrite sensing domain-containing protein [Kitasatospora sp. NBC_00070]|uniref:sensor histidine kinase n=1 Tax=Kitasatospora sp. NBC_00070 TaxID=2975962 RepID=UPI003247DB57